MSFGRKLMGSVGCRSPVPSPIDDDRLTDEPGKWNAQPDGLPSLVESFIQTAKLYDILDEILDREELHEAITPVNDAPSPSKGRSNIGTILDLDTMVMEWLDNLPSYLRYDPDSTIFERADAVTLDGLEVPSKDLLVQAKRLYLRYLLTLSHPFFKLRLLTIVDFSTAGCSYCAPPLITSLRSSRRIRRTPESRVGTHRWKP